MTYERAGQVCASASDEQVLVAAVAASDIPEDAQITITAYSDRVELRNPSWKARNNCTLPSVPSDFTGHERLAALRALNVIAIARRAGLAAFNKPPFFIRGIQNDISSQSRLIVQCERTLSEGTDPRRVEIRWTRAKPPAPETPKSELCQSPPQTTEQPSSPATISTTPPPLSSPAPQPPIVMIPPARRVNWRRPAGWSSFAVGSAALALSISFFGVGASMENRSLQALDPVRRQFLSEQANDYYRGGGGVAAVGAGFFGAGIYLLVSGRLERAARVDEKSTQSAAAGGVQLSFAGAR